MLLENNTARYSGTMALFYSRTIVTTLCAGTTSTMTSLPIAATNHDTKNEQAQVCTIMYLYCSLRAFTFSRGNPDRGWLLLSFIEYDTLPVCVCVEEARKLEDTSFYQVAKFPVGINRKTSTPFAMPETPCQRKERPQVVILHRAPMT